MFVAEPVPLDVSEPVPNGDRRMFSPLSVTMVYGDKGAVLVDPPMTRAQFEDVAAWVQASGKNLTHIFATHGHGDHWFTADLLAQRFGARVDVIYNGVHQFLVEFKNGGLDAWRKAIEIVAGLRPRFIVAGHKNKNLDDDATRTISETREYLDVVDELLARHKSALDFFNAMLERFPTRLNPGALWSGAVALYA